MDTKLGTLTVRGLERSSRLYPVAGFQSELKGGSVYREDRYECYRVGTELHMGGRRCEEAPRRRDTMENYSELQSPYQCCSNGVIYGK
jgi:hypothetical protein